MEETVLKSRMTFTCYIPDDVYKPMCEFCKAVGITRNGFLVEAVREKLAKLKPVKKLKEEVNDNLLAKIMGDTNEKPELVKAMDHIFKTLGGANEKPLE